MQTDAAAKTPPVNPAGAAASQRKKQIVVVVLVVGLIVALLTQPEKEDESAGGVSDLQTTSAPAATPVSLPGPAAVLETDGGTEPEAAIDLAEIRQWSRFELDEIVNLELLAPELNPLANSPALQVPEVQAVYGNSASRAALVGQDIVRGGQPLSGVGKVLSVSDEGIEISR